MPTSEDSWDFYPSRPDDAPPASVWINLQYRDGKGPDLDTMYWVRVQMSDPGEHALGTETEANHLWSVEDRVERLAAHVGLHFVARVRTRGTWEMIFYGAPGQGEALEAGVADVDSGGRTAIVGASPDAGWERYRALLPDPERWQWIQDRKTVETLQERGDRQDIPRRVDHWAYFPSEEKRDAFVTDARRIGFTDDVVSSADADEYAARVFHTDRTDLETIHSGVMRLFDIATRHGGYYDGWETSVESGSEADVS